MGCYIDPQGMTKEEFLKLKGQKVDSLSWRDRPEGSLPVILIDNGIFTAAGVAYSEQELNAFTRSDDMRPKTFYYVPIEDLKSVSPIASYLE